MKGIVREYTPGVYTIEYVSLENGQVSKRQAIPVSKSFFVDVTKRVGQEIEFMPCDTPNGKGQLAYPINSKL